jgi:hypothetical protein
MTIKNSAILFKLPSFLTYGRVKMVVPTFPTLLANSARQMTRNKRPFLGTIFADQLDHGRVFLVGPRSLDETGFQDLLPAVHALQFGMFGKVFGDLFPVAAVIVHGLAQELVFALFPPGSLTTTSAFSRASAHFRLSRRRCIGGRCGHRRGRWFLVGHHHRRWRLWRGSTCTDTATDTWWRWRRRRLFDSALCRH